MGVQGLWEASTWKSGPGPLLFLMREGLAWLTWATQTQNEQLYLGPSKGG